MILLTLDAARALASVFAARPVTSSANGSREGAFSAYRGVK